MADYKSSMAGIPADRDYKEVDVDGAVVAMQPDGDATVYLAGHVDDTPLDQHFDDNLARAMDKTDRKRIAQELIAAVEIDEESRQEWQSRVNDAMKLLGIAEPDAASSPFPGASSVRHPMLMEAMVQFSSRALPQLVPSDGPVHAKPVGQESEEKTEQAERVAKYLNWRLMVDDPEWFDDTDQMLFYLPLAGSAFRKLYIDPATGKPKARYVQASQFIVPYKAKSLADAQRYTHAFDIHENDVQRAVAQGTWAVTGPDADDQTPANPALADTADDRQEAVPEQDGSRQVYEVHTYYQLPGETLAQGYELPYIITVDVDNHDLLAVRRNWQQGDERYEKQIWFAHYKFLPGLGFYGFGLLHILGDLATAASGALRALLDAAARANVQGGFKAKEARNAAGDTQIAPGEWKDIDLTAEELQKAFYTPPWPDPSPALFNLLGVLTEAGQRLANTTDVMVGEASNQAPVGTTVALIEQGMKVFAAIHRRLYRAASNEYRLFAELDASAMDQAPYPYTVAGQPAIRAEDFSDEIDVVPVANPNIYSTTQRIAQAQAVVQLTEANTDLYGLEQRREAHERLLTAMGVPDTEALLPEVTAQRMGPVEENQNMLVGKPVKAFPAQDHQAHIKLHEDAMARFATMQGPIAEQFQAMQAAHIAQHYAYNYRARVMQQTGVDLPPGLRPDGEHEVIPIERENEIAEALAARLPEMPSPAEQQAAMERAAFQAEQRRKDAETQAKIARENAAAAAKRRRETLGWRQEQAQDAAEFAQERQQESEKFAQDRAQEAGRFAQEREQEDVRFAQDYQQDTANFLQERRQDATRFAQERQQDAAKFRQGQDRENAEFAAEQLREDHEAEREQARADDKAEREADRDDDDENS